MIAYTIEWLDW